MIYNKFTWNDIACSLKSLETLVKMGERVAVKKGSLFERTNSQKKQLALQTENSTVGISLFQDMSSTDSALLGGDPQGDPHGPSRSQSEEQLSSGAFARQQAGSGDGVAGGVHGSDPSNQWDHGSGQEPAGGGQQQPGSQQGALWLPLLSTAVHLLALDHHLLALAHCPCVHKQYVWLCGQSCCL